MNSISTVIPTKKQSIAKHLDEFRLRALYYLTTLLVCGLVGYFFQDKIISILVHPLGQKLIYSSPAGGFDFLIKVCLFFAFIASLPVGVYQLIRFVTPAVPKKIIIKSGRILAISSFLACIGVLFAYVVCLPAALHFLNRFSNENIQSFISANEYINFVMVYVAGFAALFQMPLVFWIINYLRRLSVSALIRQQRWVVLLSYLFAAILTPTPDPINQTLMAVPMILLFELSVLVVWRQNRRDKVAQ